MAEPHQESLDKMILWTGRISEVGYIDITVKPVQTGRGRRCRWRADQKLMVLPEWQTGVSLEEICRKYAVNAGQMYRWKCSLNQGLKEPGERVPKSPVLSLKKRAEELERAWGTPCLFTFVDPGFVSSPLHEAGG